MVFEGSSIVALVKDALPDAVVDVRDLVGDSNHFAVHVSSKAFNGKTRVDQHRIVYDALKGAMDRDLHALSIQTSVPDA